MTDAASAALQCVSRTTATTAMRAVHKAFREKGDTIRVRLSLPATDPIPAGGAVVWRVAEVVKDYFSVVPVDAGEALLAKLEGIKGEIRKCGTLAEVTSVTTKYEVAISQCVLMCLAYYEHYHCGRAKSIDKWARCHSLASPVMYGAWLKALREKDPRKNKGNGCMGEH
ncbi:hypothetical protein KIPB_014541 [Kipferlia bialata]|uniref:Uncharacterized protein n=1 Tax=Kipferlia bialata TaxID=797122 RepID=A0A391NTJ1_9EUKA|nr:hypothetical protein KIPB_014541 [Kipferlia bialata]|eukprot:g14541.t1